MYEALKDERKRRQRRRLKEKSITETDNQLKKKKANTLVIKHGCELKGN